MTPLVKRQLCDALRAHYRSTPRAKKTPMLDAFVKATGYHRKYALTLLGHVPHRAPRRGPTWIRYDQPVIEALRRLWEASGYLCSKRLHPFLGPLLEALDRAGALRLGPPLKQAVLQMSPATIDRKLAPYRRRLKPRGLSTSRPGTLLRPQVPIRTGLARDERRPGFTEMDLVGHCGTSTHGEYVQTLTVVDLATGWLEAQAVPNRGQRAVFAALTTIRQQLPFPLRGFHSDNDLVFLNDHLIRYCRAEQLTFTRSRDYMKNDQAHVEERNGAVIRRFIGYDRYEGAADAFNRVYSLLRLWINFFQPSMKLISKQRIGAKVIKRYDQAKTPYQRVLDSAEISRADKVALRRQYQELDPIQIQRDLQHRIEALWTLALRSDSGMRQQPGEGKILG